MKIDDTISRQGRDDRLQDKWWRLNNLYWILDDDGVPVKFRCNVVQKMLFEDTWWKNIILKARQLGITTFVDLYILDECLFHSNLEAAIIAHTKDDAEKIFRRKIVYPYRNMPDWLQKERKLIKDSQEGYQFSNNSIISVTTSARSGTLQLLHVSEYAKICSKYPDKAREVKTGSIPAASGKNALMWIESTAEGQGGDYYDKTITAQNLKIQDKQLTRMDFKFWFFPWYEHPNYQLGKDEAEAVVIDNKFKNYFHDLEVKKRIEIPHIRRAWYVKAYEIYGDDLKREMPSCISGDTLIDSSAGLVPIRGVIPDGHKILAHYDKGEKEVFKVTTLLGYTFRGTAEHKALAINTPEKNNRPYGWISIEELDNKTKVRLRPADFGREIQYVHYNPLPFVESRIKIDEDFARFIGLFMGDGCFGRNIVGISCDAQDQDVVEESVRLITKYFGDATKRVIGNKKGGIEVRKGNIEMKNHFYPLDIIRQNDSRNFKRKINVPWYIKRSPKNIVAEFLKGLFEADGFAQKNGTGVKIHSKCQDFLQDVQLLLLMFGITSRLSAHHKKSSSDHWYLGWELCLRTEEGRIFAKEIGFLSKRKNERLLQIPEINAAYSIKRKQILMEDTIYDVSLDGKDKVYDITTSTKDFSAGGIVVHNCPEEAFEQAIHGTYFASEFRKIREEGRVTKIPIERGLSVHTWWDLGYNDTMAIWFVQVHGREVRCINYYENSHEGLAHYKKYLDEFKKEHDLMYGQHLAPHDIQVHELTSGESRLERALAMGIRFVPTPRVTDKMDSIEAARNLLSITYFDEERCSLGIQRLEKYRKEWNERLQSYASKPLHDENSNGADAFQTGAWGKRYLFEGSLKKRSRPRKRVSAVGWT